MSDEKKPRERWIILKDHDPDQVIFERNDKAILFREVIEQPAAVDREAEIEKAANKHVFTHEGATNRTMEDDFKSGARWADASRPASQEVCIEGTDNCKMCRTNLKAFQERIKELERELAELRASMRSWEVAKEIEIYANSDKHWNELIEERNKLRASQAPSPATVKMRDAIAYLKSEIERGKNIQCIGCCNGNDIPEGEICRACWRIWIKEKMYLLWDWRVSEEKIDSALAAYELEQRLAKDGK